MKERDRAADRDRPIKMKIMTDPTIAQNLLRMLNDQISCVSESIDEKDGLPLIRAAIGKFQADSELLAWTEKTKAQLWWDKFTGKWTLFLRGSAGQYPIQVMALTLRDCITLGKTEWEKNRK